MCIRDRDLVLVDAHDVAGDNVALTEHRHGEVVVGDDLAVHLDEVAFATLHDPGVVGRRRLVVGRFVCPVVSLPPGQGFGPAFTGLQKARGPQRAETMEVSVSYTHLTLPTIYSV